VISSTEAEFFVCPLRTQRILENIMLSSIIHYQSHKDTDNSYTKLYLQNFWEKKLKKYGWFCGIYQ